MKSIAIDSCKIRLETGCILFKRSFRLIFFLYVLSGLGTAIFGRAFAGSGQQAKIFSEDMNFSQAITLATGCLAGHGFFNQTVYIRYSFTNDEDVVDFHTESKSADFASDRDWPNPCATVRIRADVVRIECNKQSQIVSNWTQSKIEQAVVTATMFAIKNGMAYKRYSVNACVKKDYVNVIFRQVPSRFYGDYCTVMITTNSIYFVGGM